MFSFFPGIRLGSMLNSILFDIATPPIPNNVILNQRGFLDFGHPECRFSSLFNSNALILDNTCYIETPGNTYRVITQLKQS